jgi:hypothetical protein
MPRSTPVASCDPSTLNNWLSEQLVKRSLPPFVQRRISSFQSLSGIDRKYESRKDLWNEILSMVMQIESSRGPSHTWEIKSITEGSRLLCQSLPV